MTKITSSCDDVTVPGSALVIPAPGHGWQNRGMRCGFLAVWLCCLGFQAFAQQTAPNPSPLPEAPSTTHRFWDNENKLLFSGVAVFRALDYASTRNFQARGREETLLPDEVVNNDAGFASLEAAATVTSVALSYLLHRTGHHRLERWLSIGHITVAAFGDVRNYTLKSGHRVAAPH